MAVYRQNYQRRYTPYSERRLAKKSRNKLIITIILAAGLLYLFLFWAMPTVIGSLSMFNKSSNKPDNISETAAIAPPVLNIPYEATSSSSIQVKGYSTAKYNVEIYLDDELKTATRVSDDGSFTTDEIDLKFGRNNITAKTVDDEGNKSFSSKNIVVNFDDEEPKLEILEPQDNQEIVGGDKKIKVSGTTESDSIVVTINGTRVIVNSTGNFSQTVSINEGENGLNIKAIDNAGNVAEVNRKVIWKPS